MAQQFFKEALSPCVCLSSLKLFASLTHQEPSLLAVLPCELLELGLGLWSLPESPLLDEGYIQWEMLWSVC